MKRHALLIGIDKYLSPYDPKTRPDLSATLAGADSWHDEQSAMMDRCVPPHRGRLIGAYCAYGLRSRLRRFRLSDRKIWECLALGLALFAFPWLTVVTDSSLWTA